MKESGGAKEIRVVRCCISDNDKNQAVITIDDHELNTEEFGRMLVTFAGRGMRIEFVPDEEVHQRPELVIREPDND